MKQSGFAVLVVALALVARAADATSPVDYQQRNETFAPGTGVTAPVRQTPQTNEAVQQKRVAPPTIDKASAAVGERRAAIPIEEKKAKNVRVKDSHRPEKIEEPTSAFSHRRAEISTSSNTTKPPLVAKYQESLAAATPWGPAAATGNKPNFSATDAAATAKINRFVFRKNPADPAALTGGAPVTPAAGGAAHP